MNCACLSSKYLYIGTLTGVFHVEFPPTKQTKFSPAKNLPKEEVTKIASMNGNIFITMRSSEMNIYVLKGNKTTTIPLSNVNTMTPIVNDIWVGCTSGELKVIDNTTFSITDMVTSSSTDIQPITGGCVLNIIDISQHRNEFWFYYADGKELKYFKTPYYKHNFITNSTDGTCNKCHKQIHKKSGLICTYCNKYYHEICCDLRGIGTLCSRDPNKGKPKRAAIANSTNSNIMNLSGSTSPRRSNSANARPISTSAAYDDSNDSKNSGQ